MAKKSESKKAAADQSALKSLMKMAEGSVPDPSKPHELTWYMTGCTAYDCATANGHPGVVGGFPAGRIVELYGNESSGKTTLALQAAARLQKQGKLVVYVDYERTFHEGYARSLGLDTTDFLTDGGLFWLLEPDFMEKGFELLDELCTNPATKDRVGMFIIDSVAAQVSMHAKDAKDEHDRLGLVAAQMSRFLPVLLRKLKETSAVCVFINQTRQNPSAGPFGDPVSTPGGKSLKFYASLRIALARGNKIYSNVLDPFKGTKEKTAIGHWVRLVIKKNKVSGEYYNDIMIPVVDNLGVDNVLSCIGIAKALKILSISGAWLTVPAEIAGSVEAVSGNGPLGLRQQLVMNPEVCDRFVENVTAKLHENFRLVQEAREGGRVILDALDDDQLDEAS